jgi:2-oxoglutarate ferredoxin oxidoreductase subunit beta
MGSILRSVQKLELVQDDVAVISGIGCTGRMPVYMDFNTMHTTHGRALAFATGLKLARPEMEILVVMGDGDALAIGGNHFIHAARRNIDLTAIVVNNNIYGMTGGQSSPTTPLAARSATAPYGHIEQPFPVCDLAMAAGASFVARSTVYHVTELDRIMEKALLKNGFSVVEVASYCHTTFGRANDLKSPIEMMRRLKQNSVAAKAAARSDDEVDESRIIRGILRDVDKPEFTELYDQVIEKAHGTLPPRKRKVRRGWA